MSDTRQRLWRASFAFLVLPGTVGLFIPFLLRPANVAAHAAGMPLLALGSGLLLWCVRDFYTAGLGSLAPWAPPKRLVIVGLYRVSRNPMYVAVLIVLCGWALTFPSLTLWVYSAAVAIAFHLRVVFGEEPWLARTHGADWAAYRASVPRWIGRASLRPHAKHPAPAG